MIRNLKKRWLTAIAAHNMGYELTGFEIDKDYYNAAFKRLEVHKQQLRMF